MTGVVRQDGVTSQWWVSPYPDNEPTPRGTPVSETTPSQAAGEERNTNKMSPGFEGA